MTIKEFAERHKIRIKHDEEGEIIVVGNWQSCQNPTKFIMAKHGQVYDFGSGQFGVMFMLRTPRQWNARRQECEKAGMRVIQDGDTEGCLLFDPENAAQSKTAIKAVGAYRKVNLSPEQRQAKAERMARVREFKKAPSISDERG